MKYLFYLITLLILGLPLAGLAQENGNVSADTVIAGKVLKTFHNKYPKINPDEWVVENGNYIITFFDDNKWFDVTITEKGKWVSVAVIIDYEDLPNAIRKNFEASKYNDMELYKIQEFENTEGETLYSLFLVDYSDNEIVLKYKKDGSLVQ